MVKVQFPNGHNVLRNLIKASEMLVAPRISEYFLKFRNLKIWKFENFENLENFGTFGKF